MKTTNVKLFVHLLEHMVNESSTSIDTLRGVPGAAELFKALHKNHIISHDVEYEPIKKISWKDIKDSHAVILLAGPDSAGVLYHGDYSYDLIAYNPELKTVETYSSDSGSRALAWIQEHTGKINKMWMGPSTSGGIKYKKNKRATQKHNPTTTYYNPTTFTETILKRFKPLWLRSLKGAQNDVKGWVNTQVKNHAFQKARTKLEHLQRLEDAVEAVENGRLDLMNIELVKRAITHAVYQTTHMYYPEKTGGFSDRYGGNYPALNDHKSIENLFNDITAGDTHKLGTLLGFFRRNLVSG